jgi:hypothetical protein
MRLSGVTKLVLALLIFGLIVYEAVAVGVNFVQLDDIAGTAIREGAAVPRAERTEPHVERAVRASLEEHPGATLESFRMNGESLEVTVRRTARVLVLTRLGPLADWADNSVTKRARFR